MYIRYNNVAIRSISKQLGSEVYIFELEVPTARHFETIAHQLTVHTGNLKESIQEVLWGLTPFNYFDQGYPTVGVSISREGQVIITLSQRKHLFVDYVISHKYTQYFKDLFEVY